MRKSFLISGLLLITSTTFCQGLENIIVETYCISESNFLPGGSVTYRIYVDMAPGYRLNTVYGDENHLLRIATTTHFFNDPVWGAASGDRIHSRAINLNMLYLDSWLSVGAATNSHHGVLLSDDNDGSFIQNESFSTADGLMEGKPPVLIPFNLKLKIFEDDTVMNIFSTNNGAWGVFQIDREFTPDNKVLIAQLTTSGKLSFELNIQLGTPDCGEPEIYVARNPMNNEIQFDGLIFGE